MLDLQMMFTKMSYSVKVDIIVSMNVPLTLSRTINFRLFQTERVCRQQF